MSEANLNNSMNKNGQPLLNNILESSRDRIFANMTQDCVRPFQRHKFEFQSSQQFEPDQIPCSNNLDIRSSFLNKSGEGSGNVRDKQLVDENIMDYFVSQYQERANVHDSSGKCIVLNEKIPILSQLNNANSYARRSQKYTMNHASSKYSSGNVSFSFFANSVLFNPREEKNMPTKDKVENWLERTEYVLHDNDASGAELSMNWEETEFDYPNNDVFGENFSYVDYLDIIHLQRRKIDTLVRKAYFNEWKRYPEDTFDVSTLSSK